MKKLLAIIAILCVVFVGLIIYQQHQKSNQKITVNEINQIETYIQKIYMWKEITGEALPAFENINEASDIWIWEVVEKNLEDYELTYEQIQGKAEEIFGEEFTKEFPRQGSEFLEYDDETDKYYATGISLDQKEDLFLMNTIEKTPEGYEVEIVEYIEDYSRNAEGIYIQNTKEEDIANIKAENAELEVVSKQIVKEHINQFSKKKLYLKGNERTSLFSLLRVQNQ